MKRALVPLLIALVGAGAPALSTWLYFSAPPAERTNFGRLVGPAPLPERMTDTAGAAFAPKEFGGKWVVAHADDASCASAGCRRKMCLLRFLSQSRPEAEFRTERLFWARGAGPVPARLQVSADCGQGFERLAKKAGPVDALSGVRVVRFEPHVELWLRAAAGGEPEEHVYLIDPRGNLMMRYGKDDDPYRMAKDFRRLLRLSRGVQG